MVSQTLEGEPPCEPPNIGGRASIRAGNVRDRASAEGAEGDLEGLVPHRPEVDGVEPVPPNRWIYGAEADPAEIVEGCIFYLHRSWTR